MDTPVPELGEQRAAIDNLTRLQAYELVESGLIKRAMAHLATRGQQCGDALPVVLGSELPATASDKAASKVMLFVGLQVKNLSETRIKMVHVATKDESGIQPNADSGFTTEDGETISSLFDMLVSIAKDKAPDYDYELGKFKHAAA